MIFNITIGLFPITNKGIAIISRITGYKPKSRFRFRVNYPFPGRIAFFIPPQHPFVFLKVLN